MQFLAKSITFEVDNSAGQEYEYRDGQPIGYKFSYIGRATGILGNGCELEIILTEAETRTIMDIIAERARLTIADLAGK